MEDLHHRLEINSGRVVGIYDEISVMYEQMDRNKTGNLDKKQLLTMFNGGSWRRNLIVTRISRDMREKLFA